MDLQALVILVKAVNDLIDGAIEEDICPELVQQDSQSNQHVPISSNSAIVDWPTTPTFDNSDTTSLVSPPAPKKPTKQDNLPQRDISGCVQKPLE